MAGRDSMGGRDNISFDGRDIVAARDSAGARDSVSGRDHLPSGRDVAMSHSLWEEPSLSLRPREPLYSRMNFSTLPRKAVSKKTW